jgi:hypothetical protein
MPKIIKKTRKNRKTHSFRKSVCSSPSLASFEKEIVVKFLELLNTIKLFHWKTHSYATHKATDELYSKINENVDTFVEVLLGKCGNRIHLEHIKHISLKDFTHVEEFKREMENFKSYLIGLDTNKGLQTMSNSDLYNIRDELLANINQFLYLLTFK